MEIVKSVAETVLLTTVDCLDQGCVAEKKKDAVVEKTMSYMSCIAEMLD